DPGVPWSATLRKANGSATPIWSIVSGPAWMQIDPQTGRLFGTPTGMADETVTVRVEETVLPTNYAEATFDFSIFATPTAPYYEADLTSSGGWTVAGEWERGVVSSGPGSCVLGGECLATRLAGTYGDNASWAGSIATSPQIDLTEAVDPLLTFQAWVHTEGPSYDAFNVRISRDGSTWDLPTDVLPAYTGSADGQQGWGGDLSGFGWRTYSIDLSAYAGSTIQVRFAFRSDSSGVRSGIYVDDVRIQTAGFLQVALFSNDLPAVAPVGMPLQATFQKTGGTRNVVWSLTPLQNAAWLDIDPMTGALLGTPTAAEIGSVAFMVHVDVPGFAGNFHEDTFGFDVVQIPAGLSYFDDFEDMNRWTLRGDWEYGTPTNVGPAACRSGASCLATKLNQNATGGLSVSANYVNSPPMMVPAGAPSKLTFWAWVDTTAGNSQWFQAQVLRIGEPSYLIPPRSDVQPAYMTGSSAWGGRLGQLGWRKYSIDLSAYAGQNIRVAFMMSTTSDHAVGAGAYVDDVSIEPADAIGPSIVEDELAIAYVDVPYTQQMMRTQGPAALTWSIVGGINHGWLGIDPATGRLSGTPTLGDIGPVSVVVRAEDPADPTREDERELEFEVSGAEVYYSTGFEGPCPGGWALTGEWQCGTPASGPGSAFGGTKAIATNLASDYSNGLSWSDSRATSPDIDLSAAVAPEVWFRMWLHTEGWTYDGVRLEVRSAGGSYQAPSAITPVMPLSVDGSQAWGGNHSGSGWFLVHADLSAFAGDTVNLRFSLATDGSGQYPGAYIDDVVVVEAP
ncbi:MAG TPA: choice-of-anchor J domain-containing protein, partial [Vulgatibacter sp.]